MAREKTKSYEMAREKMKSYEMAMEKMKCYEMPTGVQTTKMEECK
jgi:hypothetical protein